MKRDNSASREPQPPGFHWIFVLLLTVATVGIFGDVWAIAQAVWARKFDRSSKALYGFILSIVLYLLGYILQKMNASQAVEIPLFLASFVLTIVASFSVRDSLGEYITKVRKTPTFLSGVMTIFFGPIYLQYHMNRVRSFQRHAALECAITREC